MTTKRLDRPWLWRCSSTLAKRMRGRAADIDAHGLELDVLLAPDELGELGALFFRWLAVLVQKFGVMHAVVCHGTSRPARS